MTPRPLVVGLLSVPVLSLALGLSVAEGREPQSPNYNSTIYAQANGTILAEDQRITSPTPVSNAIAGSAPGLPASYSASGNARWGEVAATAAIAGSSPVYNATAAANPSEALYGLVISRLDGTVGGTVSATISLPLSSGVSLDTSLVSGTGQPVTGCFQVYASATLMWQVVLNGSNYVRYYQSVDQGSEPQCTSIAPTPAAITITQDLPVGTPFSISLGLALNVGFNHQAPSTDSASGSATAQAVFGFTRSGPVLDLPAGYTLYSLDGRIVDNRLVPDVEVRTVLPGDPSWWPFEPAGTAVQIGANNPRSGLGSVEFVNGIGVAPALVHSAPSGTVLGTVGDLDVLSFEWFIDPGSQRALPPDLALRVYPYGDPRTFFLRSDPCSTPPACPAPVGSWETSDLIDRLVIEPGESGAAPSTLAEILPDAPIVDIHLRGSWAYGLPWSGFVDNVTIGFVGGVPVQFNFEVSDPSSTRHPSHLSWSRPAAIPSGTALSSAQLNALADLPGSLSYAPAAGAVLPPDVHLLTAAFTPSDQAGYLPSAAAVPMTVTGVRTVTAADSSWASWEPDGSLARITATSPSSGSASLELMKGLGMGSALLREPPGVVFGSVSALTHLSYDWMIDPASSQALPPPLALRVYDYGDPRSFFLVWDGCSSPPASCGPHPTGSWQTTSLVGSLSIQPAENNTPPATLADIPQDAPVVGIHLRANHAGGQPWRGYVDSVKIAFGNDALLLYNFDLEPTGLVVQDASAAYGATATLSARLEAAGTALAGQNRLVQPEWGAGRFRNHERQRGGRPRCPPFRNWGGHLSCRHPGVIRGRRDPAAVQRQRHPHRGQGHAPHHLAVSRVDRGRDSAGERATERDGERHRNDGVLAPRGDGSVGRERPGPVGDLHAFRLGQLRAGFCQRVHRRAPGPAVGEAALPERRREVHGWPPDAGPVVRHRRTGQLGRGILEQQRQDLVACDRQHRIAE